MRSPDPRPPRKAPPGIGCPRDAFTLVETLVVLVLIAILSAALVAQFAGRRDDQEVRVVARDLAAAIQFAAGEAVLSQKAHRLAFLEKMNGYRVESVWRDPASFRPVKGMAGTVRHLKNIRIHAILDDQGRDLRDPEHLLFEPDRSGFAGEVHLTGRSGQIVRLIVRPRTAQVDVLR